MVARTLRCVAKLFFGCTQDPDLPGAPDLPLHGVGNLKRVYRWSCLKVFLKTYCRAQALSNATGKRILILRSSLR